MKFKNYIETESGIKDTSTSPGTAGQLLSSTVAGTSWIDQSTIASGSAEVVEVPVKNLQGSALTKGDPVYISGSVGASGILEVQLADAGNAAKMPAVGLLKQDLAANAQGFVVVTGKLRNLITSPIDGVTPNPNTVIYVKSGGSTGAALTTVKPGGSTNFIQNVGKVGRPSTSADGTLVVSSILRSNDVPNLPTGRLFVGTATNTSLISDVVYIDDANDRVGIGTNSPQEKLHIYSTGSGPVRAEIESTQATDAVLKYTNSNRSYGTFLTQNGNFSIYDYNAASHRFYMLANGNVGINTTNSNYKLEVNGTLGVSRTDGIIFAGSGGSGQGNKITSDTSNNLIFSTSLPNAPYTTAEKVRILNNGNVGIGTDNPGEKLDVNGVIRGEQYLRLADTGGTNRFSIRAESTYGTIDNGSNTLNYNANNHLFLVGFSEKMRIANNGNVGIGTTDPTYLLDVNEDDNVLAFRVTGGGGGAPMASFVRDVGSTGSSVNINAQGNFPQIQFANTGNTFSIGGDTAGNFKISDNTSIGTNDRITIDNTGNVGIGTTSPEGKLHIGGISDIVSGLVLEASDTGDNRVIDFQNTAGALRLGLEYDNANINLNLVDRNRNKLVTFREGGNVGIGTDSPDSKLHVYANNADAPTVLIIENGDLGVVAGQDLSKIEFLTNDQSSPGAGVAASIRTVCQNAGNIFDLAFNTQNGPTRTERMRLTGAGRLGIGVTAPGYQLQLSSNSAAKPSSSLWTVVSDSRVKENIRDYTTGLEAILKIEPKIYDYNGKAGFEKTKDNIGIIAQDMQNVMPETIKTYNTKLNEEDTEDTELLNFDGHAVTFALINAVKDLKAEIEELKKQINK
jgi:hypothetical protein